MSDIRYMSYQQYRSIARDGDIVLYRKHGWNGVQRLIADATGGPYYHVMGLAWNEFNGRLWEYGYQLWGGYGHPFSQTIYTKSGLVSIYRLKNPPADMRPIITEMIGGLKGVYQFEAIGLIALAHTILGPILTKMDWYKRAIKDCTENSMASICSEDVCRYYEKGGITLAYKPFATVSPNDISRSELLEYVCDPTCDF